MATVSLHLIAGAIDSTIADVNALTGVPATAREELIDQLNQLRAAVEALCGSPSYMMELGSDPG